MKIIEKMLSDTGLRRTQQRINILKVLQKAKRPVSQHEIRRKLRKSSPNKVTVYRCLEKFMDSGLVHQAYVQDRISYYELGDRCSKQQCHPHFTCLSCGNTSCMETASVPMAKGISRGFKIHRQQVRLEGICPNCS